MTDMPEKQASCDSGSCSKEGGFNYCLWSKIIVGVPAITLVSYGVAMNYSSAVSQMIMFPLTAIVLVAGAVAIDRAKIFSGKVVKRK